WDALEARLAAALSEHPGRSGPALPSYRRPWFASLIRQGREAESAGRALLAAHCHARLEREFAQFGVASPPEPAAGGTSTAPRPPPPPAALALRRDAAARARLRELLDRHAAHLSPDEVAGFAQALGVETGAAATRSASTGTVSRLRRRLPDRLMRAARYRRQAARRTVWNPVQPSGGTGPYGACRTGACAPRATVVRPRASPSGTPCPRQAGRGPTTTTARWKKCCTASRARTRPPPPGPRSSLTSMRT